MGFADLIPPDAWTAILPQDVDWSRGSVPDRGLFSIMVTDKADPLSAQTQGPGAVPVSGGTLAAEQRCQARLEKLMANGGGPAKTKSEYRHELCDEFKVSGRAFDGRGLVLSKRSGIRLGASPAGNRSAVSIRQFNRGAFLHHGYGQGLSFVGPDPGPGSGAGVRRDTRCRTTMPGKA